MTNSLSAKMASVPDAASEGPKIKSKNRVTQVFRLAAQSPHNSQSYLGHYYRSQRARHDAPKATTYDETVFAELEARNHQRQLRKLQSLAKQMGYSLVEATA